MNGSTNQGDRKRNPRNLSPKPPPPSGGELLTSQPEHTGNRGRRGFSFGGRLRRSAHSLRIRSCAFSRSRAENGHLPVLPSGRRVCTLEGQPLDQQQVQSERIKAGRGGGQARAGLSDWIAPSRTRAGPDCWPTTPCRLFSTCTTSRPSGKGAIGSPAGRSRLVTGRSVHAHEARRQPDRRCVRYRGRASGCPARQQEPTNVPGLRNPCIPTANC